MIGIGATVGRLYTVQSGNMSTGVKMTRPVATAYATAIEASAATAIHPCGSYRRGAPLVGDLDIAVVTGIDTFASIANTVAATIGATILRGGARLAVLVTPEQHQIDLYQADEENIGAMLLFLTGSGRHNIKLRAVAKHKGLLLNQYGLYNRETGELIANKTEHDIFAALNLPYTPPEKR
jgi:DNA polymerase (family 10)